MLISFLERLTRALLCVPVQNDLRASLHRTLWDRCKLKCWFKIGVPFKPELEFN